MEPRKQKELYRSNHIYQIPIERIVPNPQQPRKLFEETALRELAASIEEHGILQPLTVQKRGSGYVLVAGERRLRAAGLAGLSRVPCILIQGEAEDSAVLALIENVQRRDLHYMEEAAALSRLIREHGLSQEEAARRLGRSQSAVANKLRLLRLSTACVELLQKYGLTERHARALLRLTSDTDREAAASHMGQKHLTVAEAEAYIDSLLVKKETEKPRRPPIYIIKDVRLFLNSLDRNLHIMRQAGVDATCKREDREESIFITMEIPKRRISSKTV